VKNGYRLELRIPSGQVDPNLERFPLLFYHEIIDREITRAIVIWADGHTGIARRDDMLELGGGVLPEHPDTEPEPEVTWPVTEISAEQFERYWEAALRRVEREVGVEISR